LVASSNESQTLIEWLEKGVFDALKKKFLKTIVFVICSDVEHEFESTIESYEFNVTYPDSAEHGVAQLDICKTSSGKKVGMRQFKSQTKTEITKSMVLLLRTLITLSQTLKPVPDSRYITMKLLYYDHVTPADYEPPFFRPVPETQARVYSKDFIKLKVGSVATSYHTMEFKVRTAQDLFEYDDTLEENLIKDSEEVAYKEKENPQKESSENSQETQITEDMNIEKQAKKQNKNSADIEKLAECFETKSTISNNERQIDTKNLSREDKIYYQALSICLQEEFVFSSKLQKVMDISAHQAKILVERMEEEGYLGKATNRRSGKPVIKNQKTSSMLKKVLKLLPELNINSKEKPMLLNAEGRTTDEVSEVNLTAISQKSVLAISEKSDHNPQADKKKKSEDKSSKSETGTKAQKKLMPEVTPNSEKSNLKRKRIEQDFEVSYSQDTLQEASIDQMSDFDFEKQFPKMSTVIEPIHQKKMRVTRDPNFQFG
jgi:hypothetical protein